eukprot:TRINITY_DN55440_c0_g1_i1.p1 TRINITY_DN55440_c0_g1~~TRINITY_DN55440_c0_g1_i1.p1  ORF type:complete len:520 (-),score=85.17 TRINITY_DN55440_c0_g1_i1:634-1965(-)
MARQLWTPDTPSFSDAFRIGSSHASPARGPEGYVHDSIAARGVGNSLGASSSQAAERMRTPSPAGSYSSTPRRYMRSAAADIAPTDRAIPRDGNDGMDLANLAEQHLSRRRDGARRRIANAELPMPRAQQLPTAMSPGLVSPVPGRSAYQQPVFPAASAPSVPVRSRLEEGTYASNVQMLATSPQTAQPSAAGPGPVLLGRRQDKVERRGQQQAGQQQEVLELQLEQRLHLAPHVPQEMRARMTPPVQQFPQWPQPSQQFSQAPPQEQQRPPQQPQLQQEQRHQQLQHQQQHRETLLLEMSQHRQDAEGQEMRPHVTTLMVWGLDKSYTQQFFIADLIASGFGPGEFDIVYLPFVLTRRECQGYAVINFKDHETARDFYDMYSPGYSSFGRFQSQLRLGVAKHQGSAANFQRLSRVSSKIHNPRFAPLGLTSAGDLAPLSTFR